MKFLRRTPPGLILNRRRLAMPGLWTPTGGGRFDGVSDYMQSVSLSPGADANRIVVSFWFRSSGGDGTSRMIHSITGSRMLTFLTTSNRVLAQCRNASNAVVWQHNGYIVYTSSTTWHHVLVYADLVSGGGFVFEDGVDTSFIVTATAGETINSSLGNHAIGASTTGASKWHGDLAEIWIGNPGRAVIASEVSKFIAGNRPANLGPQGAQPFGVRPPFYFQNPAASHGVNSGSAGNMTVVGALDDIQRPILLGA